MMSTRVGSKAANERSSSSTSKHSERVSSRRISASSSASNGPSSKKAAAARTSNHGGAKTSEKTLKEKADEFIAAIRQNDATQVSLCDVLNSCRYGLNGSFKSRMRHQITSVNRRPVERNWQSIYPEF